MAKVSYTKLDKKVPTHGPGTAAYYRGDVCKILAIENGKAKIFCNGRILLVNYTSLDDAMYGTEKKNLKESILINEGALDQKNIVANLLTGAANTFQNVIDKHPRLTSDPLFHRVAALCYKWRKLDELGDWIDINYELLKNYDIHSIFRTVSKAKIYLYAKKNSSTVVAIKYESPETVRQWYLPDNGNLNKGVVIKE